MPDLNELERLLSEAEARGKPAPWHKFSIKGELHLVCYGPQDDPSDCFDVFEDPREADCDLTIALRNAAPALIAQAREAERLRAAMLEIIDRDRRDHDTPIEMATWIQACARAALTPEKP
jgi:hypothetical protein